MAFSKKKVDDRKQWLQGFVPGTFLDHTADTISYSHFVHKVSCVGGLGACWRTPCC
jgi:DNA topoisomerase-2